MIINRTRGRPVADDVERAGNPFSKAVGLMFRSGLERGRGMLFPFRSESRVGMWMLFMRFPIDLIYLDSAKKVVGVFEDVKPVGRDLRTWKVYYPPVPAKYVLEVASGTVRETGTEVGDLLEF